MPGPSAEELAERTLQLCRIPSPIGSEQALADFVERWARSLRPAMDVVRTGHSVALGSFDDARPRVMLLGHLDTVPPHPSEGQARIEAGRIFGRGSSDMKGGLAAMMALAETLPRGGPLTVAYVFYEREEGPYTESGLGPLLAKVDALRKTRFGIALEPTDNVVQVGAMGSLHATLRFTGKSAHSARPWQGENAIHKAGVLLSELSAQPRREVRFGGFPFYEVMSITQAQGGRARNVVPDAFQLNLNYRFAPGKSLAQAQEDVRGQVAGRAEVEFIDLAPSGRVCADNPLFQKLLQISGAPAESKQAWTDVGRLSQEGIDAVNFGPGETAQAHQAGESAPIAALGVGYQALFRFLTAA
jgi:succinyl-diaminopimelate desuccinylase